MSDCPDLEIEFGKQRWSPIAWLRRLSPEFTASCCVAIELIDALKNKGEQGLTADQCQILKSRWLGQTVMYERLWRGQRSVYYLLRIPIIAGATTIPVLASLAVPKELTAFFGLGVALLAAIDGFLQLGSRWQEHRHTATELGFEGWEFLELSGGYANKTYAEAYQLFLRQLETMNRRAALSYLELFRPVSKNGSNDGKQNGPSGAGTGNGGDAHNAGGTGDGGAGGDGGGKETPS